MSEEYKSRYTDGNFFSKYTTRQRTNALLGPLMELRGDIEAFGLTSCDYEYPGLTETTVQDVSFEGILTIYPVILSDGIEIELTLYGSQAQELLEMFGWEPLEGDWDKDERCYMYNDY